MASLFREAPPADAAWAIFFLTGRRLKRVVPYSLRSQWALEVTGLPSGCSTSATPRSATSPRWWRSCSMRCRSAPPRRICRSRDWVEERLLPLQKTDPAAQRERSPAGGSGSLARERFLLNKLLTGEFRVGVSHTLVVRALAPAAERRRPRVAARLMGDWTPSAEWFAARRVARAPPTRIARGPTRSSSRRRSTGPRRVRWAICGLARRVEVGRHPRAAHPPPGQTSPLVARRRADHPPLSRDRRGGHPPAGRHRARRRGPRLRDGRPLPFSALQQRIGRQKQLAQIMRAVPVVFMVYDILEDDGVDIRGPRRWRSAGVHALRVQLVGARRAPPRRPMRSRPRQWDELAALRRESRDRGVEGFILKRLTSAYGVGRANAATGGSGRSIRSRSTPCSSTRSRATAAGPAC